MTWSGQVLRRTLSDPWYGLSLQDAELAQELTDADMVDALFDAINCKARAKARTGHQMHIFGESHTPWNLNAWKG